MGRESEYNSLGIIREWRCCHNKKTLKREFEAGERVLILLPVVGSSLEAKFCGPYDVERQLSDTM